MGNPPDAVVGAPLPAGAAFQRACGLEEILIQASL